MRYLIILLVAALMGQLLSSCEQVIDVNLNDASARYVIEGSITNEDSPYQVRITRTKNFDESNVFEGITNAVVTLSDDAGNADTLTQQSPGLYTGSSLAGVPGRTYHLRVAIGEESFSAVSAMPAPVPFDSLYTEEVSAFGDPRKIPYASYTDPAGIPNYYRFVLHVNNEKVNTIFIGRDENTDGRQLNRALPRFGDEEEEIIAGDNILVEMQSIDRPLYEYFYSLNQTLGQDAAAPGNPVMNITGGALGYFSAHTAQRKSAVVE